MLFLYTWTLPLWMSAIFFLQSPQRLFMEKVDRLAKMTVWMNSQPILPFTKLTGCYHSKCLFYHWQWTTLSPGMAPYWSQICDWRQIKTLILEEGTVWSHWYRQFFWLQMCLLCSPCSCQHHLKWDWLDALSLVMAAYCFCPGSLFCRKWMKAMEWP